MSFMAQRAGDHSAPTCTPVGVHVGGAELWLLLATQEEEDLEVIKVIPEEAAFRSTSWSRNIVEQNFDVPVPQSHEKDTLLTMEDTPKERISECTPETVLRCVRRARSPLSGTIRW